jgi:signal peptidase I
VKSELAGEVLRSAGTLRLQVTGWSMLPTLMQGDVLDFERASGEEVSTGNIVLFSRGGTLFAHRIINPFTGHKTGFVLTQGDAIGTPDPPVPNSELFGKVSRIVRAGKSIEPARTLSISARLLAALLRRSYSAVRVVSKVLRICHSLKEFAVSCQR